MTATRKKGCEATWIAGVGASDRSALFHADVGDSTWVRLVARLRSI